MTAADEIYLSVFAPVASAFVEWVISRAVRSGKKRLYFLARDGYPMYVISSMLCEMRHIDMDIRLLSVSRYALRLPEYHLLGEGAIDRIVIGGIDVTLRKIFKRGGLTDDEGAAVARALGMEAEQDKILNYGQVMELKESLRRCDVFLKYIYDHSYKAYPAAIGYMEQMGMLDDEAYALVDSGWTGTLQQTITNLLRVKKPDFMVEGYYFGLYELPRGVNVNNYHSFYFSPGKGLRRKVKFSNCLFETVFSQDCGMTLGYCKKGKGILESGAGSGEVNGNKTGAGNGEVSRNERGVENGEKNRNERGAEYGEESREESEKESGAKDEKEIYVPQKNKAGNPNSRQLNRNLEILKEYTHIYGSITSEMSEKDIDRMCEENTAACDRLLKDFMGRPEPETVKIYGNNLFCDDVLEGSLMTVARDMTEKDIKNQRLIRKIAIMSGIKREELHDSAWMEGSIVRSGYKVTRNLWHVRVYKYILYIRKKLKCRKTENNTYLP